MRRKFIFLTAALVLLAFLAVPLGMRGQAPVGTILWAEDFSGYVANDVPNGVVTDDEGTTIYGNGTVTYSVTDGGGTTKIYEAALAGGTSPELLVAKGGGTWTIAGIPTGNAVELTLSYKTNNNNNAVSSTTEGVTITEETSRASTKTFTITTGGATQITLVITNSTNSNTRVDDFSLVVKTPEGGTPTTTYTVTYNANVAGVNPVVDTYVEGANVTLRPANTFNYDGHTFSEWNTQADGDGDPYDAGDVIENIQANLQLYAIWIEDTPSGDGVVDVLNWVATGSPNSYTDWTYQAPSGAEYAGQSSGTYQSIQLRSNNNNSGIVTTTSIGNVTKVAVSWNDNTAIGRTLNVYGSNSSYSAATDLYGDNAGELLGTIVKGTNTALNINGNYAFIGLRSASGAMYLDEIDITWSVDGTPVPSITAGNVEIAYNATNGAIEYTINNPAEGGVLSATTEAEWLTIGTIGATVPFTCSMNGDVERTATVTLIYTYNSDQTISKNVTVTQASNPNSPGSETNPYTVAQARAAIDAGMGTQGVYATGIVSEIPTPYNSTYGNVTFNMVDEAGDEVFLQAYRCGGEEAANVAIGDVVVVYGNLTYYATDGIYEFAQGCQLVSLTHPDIPFISVNPYTINFAATGTNGFQTENLTIAYENIVVTNYQSFTVQFYDNQGNETTMPTDWLIVGVTGTNEEGYVVRCVATNNDGEARTAYFKVYAFDAENNKVYSNLVTVNQAEYVAPTYATLPFEFDGGKAAIDTIDGLYQEGLGTDYNNSPKLRFDHTGDWLLLQFQEVPGTLTFDIKGNNFSNGTFKVQTSEDGVTYTDLETYTELGATHGEEFDNLGENVRYIKWIYTEKVGGNVALGNIHLYEFGGGPVIETYDLTVEPFENLEIFTFVDDELTEPMEGAGTIQVAEGKNVMLSVSANEGYEIQSLMVDGTEHVNDIAEDLTYTFVMPAHNVTVSATAAPVVPFEPATYTLATTIESGKTYIIVGSKVIDSVANYFAMGEQRTNNRGGVAISVDGTTATVDSEDVYEFVITDIGDGFYSIYDDRTPGYLYAAGPSNNYLKTEQELDTLHNGDWAINIDEQGMFSIAASNSSNRNVMQFNGSGSNALFSCYASASQSPVYLYVKDEEPTTVTQAIALSSGKNWFSTSVEVTLNDLKAALVAALPNSVIKISAQNGNTQYNPNNHRWSGNVSWGVTNMYIVTVGSDCEITLEGMAVDPSANPITIKSGKNWIGFPLSQQMTVTNAFAGFAINGDKIKSQNANSQYNRGRWQGGVTNLENGKGYIYTSEQLENRTLVFPASK